MEAGRHVRRGKPRRSNRLRGLNRDATLDDSADAIRDGTISPLWTDAMTQLLVRTAMLVVFSALCGLSGVSFAGTDESGPLTTVDWDKIHAAGLIQAGEVVPGKDGGPGYLKIVNTETGQKTIPLLKLDAPPITTPSYALRGRIRYQDVTGVGYLEMWSHFAADQQYFTRTLGTDGPMQMVTGSSSERDFELPFHTFGQTAAPAKLVLNLVLNGPGQVEIGPLELVAIASPADSPVIWWNDALGGVIGGLGGSMLGILGGIAGTLVGLGRGKKFVLTLAAAQSACGIALLMAGFIATRSQQPISVTGVLLLLGGMMLLFGGLILMIAPGRFRSQELQRMQALDT